MARIIDWLQDLDLWLEPAIFHALEGLLPGLQLWPDGALSRAFASIARVCEGVLALPPHASRHRLYYVHSFFSSVSLAFFSAFILPSCALPFILFFFLLRLPSSILISRYDAHPSYRSCTTSSPSQTVASSSSATLSEVASPR